MEVTTTHKYKGQEADFVIVADADADKRFYPLIHPTAELFGVFGDTIATLTDADRRLFYVATTRAQSSLCHLVTTEEPSPFLGVVMATAHPVHRHDLPVAVTDADAQLEVRIHDAYEVRELLRDRFGFKFDKSNKTWYAFRPADRCDFQQIQQVLSFIGSRLIEVRDETQCVIHRAGTRLDHDLRPPF